MTKPFDLMMNRRPAVPSRQPGGTATSSCPETQKIDRAVMERIRDGDESALGTLLDRHWNALVRYASGMVGEVDAAEDVVLEAFTRLWRSRSNWAPTGSVRSYLYRIVRNLALQERERRGNRDRLRQTSIPPPPPRTPAEEMDQEELRLTIQAAFDSLPSRRREVVQLAYFHGLSYKQIAEVLGISVQTVANQVSTALSTLRKILAEHER